MRHPFESLSSHQLKWVFLSSLVVYSILQIGFVVLDVPLRNAVAPNGIVSFELARDDQSSAAILASWDETAKLDASFGLGLDYLFMCMYATLISVVCLWSGRILAANHRLFAAWGRKLAWAVWVAALFDAIENVALLLQLFASNIDPLPLLAALCATVKFTLIGACLAYSLYGAVVRLVGSRFAEASG